MSGWGGGAHSSGPPRLYISLSTVRMQRPALAKAPADELGARAQEDGGLALLDWGQCKALTASRHRALARLYVALDRGWSLGIVAAMSNMGLGFLAKAGLPPRPPPTPCAERISNSGCSVVAVRWLASSSQPRTWDQHSQLWPVLPGRGHAMRAASDGVQFGTRTRE
jgi:hypothetical protein